MNSKRIGNIGEAKVLSKLVELGIPVYIQFGDNESADYIILVNNKPLKIQVKTSASSTKNTVMFKLTSSTVHRKNGIKHIYSVDEVDLFLCYDIKNQNIFVLKNTGKNTSVTFRYNDTLNRQKTNIRMAKDYYLCVETLHDISNLDKDKVQTTM